MNTEIVGKNAAGEDVNSFGERVIPCKTGCGRKTTMTGTKLCDFCWHARTFFDLPEQAQIALAKEAEGDVVDDEVWRTSNGREIKVADMSIAHMRAALRMVARARRRRLELQRTLKELFDDDDNEEAWGDT